MGLRIHWSLTHATPTRSGAAPRYLSSGFATDAGTGTVIASLKPRWVIQPWTEDPRAKTSALTATASVYTSGKPDSKKMTAHFLGSLEDMHTVANSIARMTARQNLAGSQTLKQLQFLGEDNIKNASAVKNLMEMGRRGKAYYVNAGMKLNLLPGIKSRQARLSNIGYRSSA
jgi:hypothetical protein